MAHLLRQKAPQGAGLGLSSQHSLAAEQFIEEFGSLAGEGSRLGQRAQPP